MPYRKTRKLSECDAAYLAGLIDGEGTVTLSHKHRNENRQLCVSISSTERPMLEWVLEATGVGKITRKRVVSENHSSSFTFTVTNRQALAVLRQTHHRLKSYKRVRAGMILTDYLRLTPRNGYYSPELKRARVAFEKRLLKTRP